MKDPQLAKMIILLLLAYAVSQMAHCFMEFRELIKDPEDK